MAHFTFHGGIELREHKERTKDLAITEVLPGQLLIYPMQHHENALVIPGEYVLAGQLLARDDESMSRIHASVSGVVKAIEEQKYDSIILNFANPDMVGHTGNLDAAVKAIETIDECVGKVAKAVEKVGGVLLITADHGNAEQMVDYKTGEPHTAHTTNVVPLVLIGKDAKLKEGRLADLIPTMLEIMGIEKPQEMTGESLIEK